MYNPHLTTIKNERVGCCHTFLAILKLDHIENKLRRHNCKLRTKMSSQMIASNTAPWLRVSQDVENEQKQACEWLGGADVQVMHRTMLSNMKLGRHPQPITLKGTISFTMLFSKQHATRTGSAGSTNQRVSAVPMTESGRLSTAPNEATEPKHSKASELSSHYFHSWRRLKCFTATMQDTVYSDGKCTTLVQSP